MPKRVDTHCQAFQLAIDVLKRPWSAVILNLLQDGPLRFSEIGDRARGVGDKVLSARLKELESRGLITRRVEPGPPVRVAYALTPKGMAFDRVAEAIERWGRAFGSSEKGSRRRSATATAT
jgi:DNA-binding HxlR family transcriptional regulator